MIAIEPVPESITVVHSNGRQYDFQPQPGLETVVVTIYARRRLNRTTLPVEEARQLWRRLETQGFQRW